jgi:hypothetical protein
MKRLVPRASAPLLLLCAGLGAAELEYPVAGNVRPDAVTVELWFRLDEEPAAWEQRRFSLGGISWPGRTLPFTAFAYQTYWTNTEYHLIHRMGGSLMGSPNDGLPFLSQETTFRSGKPFAGARHARLHKGEWHHAAWTAREASQPWVTVFLDGEVVYPERQVMLDPWIDLDKASLRFAGGPVTLDELRVSSVARAPDEVAASFRGGAPARDEHTLLLDRFARAEKAPAGDFAETLAECIGGYHGERGGRLKGTDFAIVEGRFGKALQLIAPKKP